MTIGRVTFASIAAMAIVCATYTYASIPRTAEATDCSSIPGTRSAVASDAAVQNGTVKIGTCYNPNQIGVDQASEQAKSDLNSMWCGGTAASCTLDGTTYTSSVPGLNNTFARCADAFMKALRQQDPSACIRSAYRSTDHQVCVCGGNANGTPGKCAAAGRSYHQLGLAIDVNMRIPAQQAWKIATQSTNGGLGNPNSLHTTDPTHFQALAASCNSGSGPGILGTPGDLTPAAAAVEATQDAATAANAAPTGICSPQTACSGATVVSVAANCAQQVVQVCTNGCYNGACINTTSPCPIGSVFYNNTCVPQQCPQGSTMSNNMCVPQQCPTGSVPYNGTCYPMNGQPQQPAQATPSTAASTPSTAATASPTSSAVPSSGSLLATPTTVAGSNTGVSTNSIASPTLTSSLLGQSTSPTSVTTIGSNSGAGNSAINTINQLANASSTNGMTATSSPITQIDSLSNVSQIQAGFSSPSQAGSPDVTSSTSNTPKNSPITVADVGPRATTTHIAVPQNRSGDDTFVSSDLRDSPAITPSSNTFGDQITAVFGHIKDAFVNAVVFLQQYFIPSRASAGS